MPSALERVGIRCYMRRCIRITLEVDVPDEQGFAEGARSGMARIQNEYAAGGSVVLNFAANAQEAADYSAEDPAVGMAVLSILAVIDGCAAVFPPGTSVTRVDASGSEAIG